VNEKSLMLLIPRSVSSAVHVKKNANSMPS
jgi:hypothetical protein